MNVCAMPGALRIEARGLPLPLLGDTSRVIGGGSTWRAFSAFIPRLRLRRVNCKRIGAAAHRLRLDRLDDQRLAFETESEVTGMSGCEFARHVLR